MPATLGVTSTTLPITITRPAGAKEFKAPAKIATMSRPAMTVIAPESQPHRSNFSLKKISQTRGMSRSMLN